MLTHTYLTQERYDEIVREVHKLKTDDRKRVAERLKNAKDLGDLSENFDYHDAREEQSRLEGRIHELEELLRNSVIIKKTGGNSTVRIGGRVTVTRLGEGFSETTFAIVGSNEAKPAEGFISNESPLGCALLGKKVGDTVTITTPKGMNAYQVVRIE
ncbi:MAG: transcription elongation factor GreA [Candidatus Brennerbacteria bacterium]|nr:transcription elongation factor GreA [Candidatus Brennerbacteria bacterium]